MSTEQLSDNEYLFTSESVTEGHPDKMADQISDAVLDAVLGDDPTGRVACETMVTTGLCVVAGEISTVARPDIARIARDTICGIGYTDAAVGLDGKTDISVSPTGAFVLGGPHADCGLTGRKIIVDTYGGMARHGGGAFSGKDPTKVDRSAAYATRQIAKSIVAAGLARRCEAQVAYAIGKARPVSVLVEAFGTAEIEPDQLPVLIQEHFDLRPAAIIDRLDLRRPIYRKTASYGHFGRPDKEFTWEQVDDVAADLRSAVGG